MMKREALEKCMDQWQWIHTELSRMEAAADDGEPIQLLAFNIFKRRVLRNAGVPTEDQPLNSCYLCEYVQTKHPTPDHGGLLACEHCPLKEYAWEQCETDGSYLACEDAYNAERFRDAAEYAQEIIEACERALEDLGNEE